MSKRSACGLKEADCGDLLRESVEGDIFFDGENGYFFPAPFHVRLWRRFLRQLTGRFPS